MLHTTLFGTNDSDVIAADVQSSFLLPDNYPRRSLVQDIPLAGSYYVCFFWRAQWDE